MQTGIEAITEKLYIPKFADNVYNSNPTLAKLNAGKKSFDGGASIVIPIEYQELVSGGSFQGLSYLDTAVNDLATQAQYEWREYYVEKNGVLSGEPGLNNLAISGNISNETIPTEVVIDPLETTRRASQVDGDIVRSSGRPEEGNRNVCLVSFSLN